MTPYSLLPWVLRRLDNGYYFWAILSGKTIEL